MLEAHEDYVGERFAITALLLNILEIRPFFSL